jgi:predicted RNase H-like HicB family nuclease
MVELAVLLIPQGPECWVAQCLQYDVAEQGPTIDAAVENMWRALLLHITIDLREGREPLARLPKAPARLWERFNHGKTLQERKTFYAPPDAVPPSRTLHATTNELRVA